MFNSMKLVLFAINCLAVLVVFVDSSKMFSKMYHQIPNTKLSYCNKFLNKTSVIGCDGPLSPSAGILLPNITSDLINHIEEYYSSYHHFVPILSASDPDLKPILIKLAKLPKGKIAGVLVINSDNRNDSPVDNIVRSDDILCPNKRMATTTTNNNNLSNQSQCSTKWINSSSEHIGSFFVHWPFQMFYIEDNSTIEYIENCTKKWNSDLFVVDNKTKKTVFRDNSYSALKPFCSAELYNPTYAPNDNVNPDLCLGRKDRIITLKKTNYCSQIYLQNILVPITPMFEWINYGKKSIIIVAVRLDSLSLFSGKSPAADSMYTALVATISLAHTMARYQEILSQSGNNVKHPVIFAFYAGESLYYIGSSYHAFSMNENQKQGPEENVPVPNENNKNNSTSYKEQWIRSGMDRLRLDQIGFVMELNQLASHTSHYGQSKFWIYSDRELQEIDDNSTKSSSLGQTVINTMRNHLSSEVDVTIVNGNLTGIPPSSVHSFVAYNNSPNNTSGTIDIEAAVITNHYGPFTNRFYHSVFDTLSNVANFTWTKQRNNESGQYYKSYDTSYLSIHLSRLVNVISKSLIEVSLGTDLSNLNRTDIKSDMVDIDFIDQMINCIFIDNNCSLFYRIRPHDPGFYNKTNFQNTDLTSNQIVTELVYDLMRTVTGQNVTCPQPEEADNPYIQAFYYYLYQSDSGQSNGTMNRTTTTTASNVTNDYQCLRHQVFHHQWTSPYFLRNVDQWIHDSTSQWVVSHKRKQNVAPRLRIFLLQSMAYEYTMYALGLTWIIVPIIIIKVCL